MFEGLGRFALKFIVAWAIISTLLSSLFIAYGIEPPEPLVVVRPSAKKLAEIANQVTNSTLPSVVLPYVIGMGMLNLVLSLLVGIPKLFYSLAKYFNMPFLIPPLMLLGGLLQVSAIYYGVREFLRMVGGG